MTAAQYVRQLILKDDSAYHRRYFMENNNPSQKKTLAISRASGPVSENQKAVINRIAHALGHLEKVKVMVEEGADCADVLIQLAAVRSALNNTGKVILKDHLRQSLENAA